MKDSILSIKNLSKNYSSGSKMVEVLKEINIEIGAGEVCSIVGPSGSGKTTLLGLCAGLDVITSGEIRLTGETLSSLTEDEKARLRNQKVGFVFQNFQLIPTLTALENVKIPLELLGQGKAAKQEAITLLDRVGLSHRMNHYPTQLSGGEQQRVALARAFANQPKILFADEPTGNLDEETSQVVEKLLFELNQEHGTTLIIVTHDLELARKTDRMVQLKGGRVVEDRLITTQTQ